MFKVAPCSKMALLLLCYPVRDDKYGTIVRQCGSSAMAKKVGFNGKRFKKYNLLYRNNSASVSLNTVHYLALYKCYKGVPKEQKICA